MNMYNEISEFSNSHVGFKQRCPLPWTLFGVSIETLEQMSYVKEEDIEEVVEGNVVIVVLLYTNDIMFFVNT